MRAREFVVEFDLAQVGTALQQVPQRLAQLPQQAAAAARDLNSPIVDLAMNTVGDAISVNWRAEYKAQCDEALDMIKSLLLSQAESQAESHTMPMQLLKTWGSADAAVARLQQVLGRVSIAVSTNRDGDHARPRDLKITMDPWTKTRDANGVVWIVAHELSHILHYQWYATYDADLARSPQAAEQFADKMAAQILTSMGITKAVVFRPDSPPDWYEKSTASTAKSTTGSHPSLRDRFDASKRQGVELS